MFVCFFTFYHFGRNNILLYSYYLLNMCFSKIECNNDCCLYTAWFDHFNSNLKKNLNPITVMTDFFFNIIIGYVQVILVKFESYNSYK